MLHSSFHTEVDAAYRRSDIRRTALAAHRYQEQRRLRRQLASAGVTDAPRGPRIRLADLLIALGTRLSGPAKQREPAL
jgi:hypothetical protein